MDFVLGIDDAVVNLLVDFQTNKGLSGGSSGMGDGVVRVLRKVSGARLRRLNIPGLAAVQRVVIGPLRSPGGGFPASTVTT